MLPFWKMNGTGNDFIVADNREGIVGAEALAQFAVRFCPRRTAVGADGVLLLERDGSGETDFRMRYLNADGSEAEMCGNGARCIAMFANMVGAAGRAMRFQTGAGPVGAQIVDDGVIIDMPAPTEPEERSLDAGAGEMGLWYLSTGVPHVVVPTSDLEAVDVEGVGRALRYHHGFKPAGTNVNFMARTGAGIAIRTYERGVEGETLACGTGATASALVASRIWSLTSPIPVEVRGGRLRIHLNRGEGGAIALRLEGPVKVAFRGELEWPR